MTAVRSQGRSGSQGLEAKEGLKAKGTDSTYRLESGGGGCQKEGGSGRRLEHHGSVAMPVSSARQAHRLPPTLPPFAGIRMSSLASPERENTSNTITLLQSKSTVHLTLPVGEGAQTPGPGLPQVAWAIDEWVPRPVGHGRGTKQSASRKPIKPEFQN